MGNGPLGNPYDPPKAEVDPAREPVRPPGRSSIVLAALASAVVAFVSWFFLVLVVGVVLFGRGHRREAAAAVSPGVDVFLVVAVVIAGIFGGYIAAMMCERRPWASAFASGLAFSALLLLYVAAVPQQSVSVLLAACVATVPAALAGARLWGLR